MPFFATFFMISKVEHNDVQKCKNVVLLKKKIPHVERVENFAN